MFDKNKIDSYFDTDLQQPPLADKPQTYSKHTRYVRLAKLLLPSVAAILIGLLLVFPSSNKTCATSNLISPARGPENLKTAR